MKQTERGVVKFTDGQLMWCVIHDNPVIDRRKTKGKFVFKLGTDIMVPVVWNAATNCYWEEVPF